MKKSFFLFLTLSIGLGTVGLFALRAQDPSQNQSAEAAAVAQHAECTMFGPQRERFANQALHASRLEEMTNQVSSLRHSEMSGSRWEPHRRQRQHESDRYLYFPRH